MSEQQLENLTTRLLTSEDLAEYLGVPVATIYKWRERGGGPPGIRVGRHTRYDPADVRRWVEERKEGAE